MISIQYRKNDISSDVPAIVLNVDGGDFIINPISLNNYLVDCNNKMNFLSAKYDEMLCHNWFDDVYSRLEMERDSIRIAVGDRIYTTTVEDFCTGLVHSIIAWRSDVVNDIKTVYTEKRETYKQTTIEEIDAIVENINFIQKLSKDKKYVKCEKPEISLWLGESMSSANSMDDTILYDIVVGNRAIHGYITFPLAEPEQTRIYLELMTMPCPDRFELFHFDDFDESYIRFERLDEGEEFIVRVSSANNKIKMLFACKLCDFISPFYQGLLASSMEVDVEEFNFSPDENINVYLQGKKTFGMFPRLPLYNKFKSPLIEEYLTTDSKWNLFSNDIPFRRQQDVSRIFIISPGYGHAVMAEIGIDDVIGIDENDILDLSNDDIDLKIHVPGLFEWHNEFEMQSDGVNSTMGSMDTTAWHNKGIAIATQIRKQLPENYDLWYGFPFENVENRGKRPILIMG